MIIDLRDRMHDWMDRYEGDATNQELVEEAMEIMSTATTMLSTCGLLLRGLLPDGMMDRLESDDPAEYSEALQEAMRLSRDGGSTDE